MWAMDLCVEDAFVLAGLSRFQLWAAVPGYTELLAVNSVKPGDFHFGFKSCSVERGWWWCDKGACAVTELLLPCCTTRELVPSLAPRWILPGVQISSSSQRFSIASTCVTLVLPE